MSRALVLCSLVTASMLACDSPRRVTAGARTPTQGRDAAAASESPDLGFDDAGRPVVFDAGFDDAGRPIMIDGGGTASRDGGPVSNPRSPAEYCAAATRLECEAIQRCCMRETGRYASTAACEADLSQRWCLTGAAIDDGRVRFDPASAGAILDALARDSAACQRSAAADGFPLVGTLRAGAECNASVDISLYFACAPGTYCGGGEELGAVCVPYARDGQSCDGARCEPGHGCDTSTFTCRPGAPLGASCGEASGVTCAAGLCNGQSCVAATSEDHCRGE